MTLRSLLELTTGLAVDHLEGLSDRPGLVGSGMAAMRISVSSWATTSDDVEQSIEAIMRAAAAERLSVR